MRENYTMLFDFYEMTMANGYFQTDYKDTITYFDLFYRKNPDKGGFVICAGLESVVEYIQNLHFFDDDIEFLRSKGIFCEEFLEYLRNFKFTGDMLDYPRLIIFGLIFGMLGDVVLHKLKGTNLSFIIGMLLFLAGHTRESHLPLPIGS